MDSLQEFSEALQVSLPAVRLGSFRMELTESADVTLARYAWNVELCEAMYPALHYFEIGLRNNVDRSLQTKFKRQQWYRVGGVLGAEDGDAVGKAMDKIIARKKVATHDRIVAELSLGFWINLFSNRYEEKIWHSGESLRTAFPNMPKYLRNAKSIGKSLEVIRSFRNRIFHHEPIWKTPIREMHKLISDYTSFLNPRMTSLASHSCRLRSVWESNPRPIAMPD